MSLFIFIKTLNSRYRLVSAYLFLLLLLTAQKALSEDFTEEFTPGWHMITIPCEPDNSDPESVFASPFEDVVGIQGSTYIPQDELGTVASGQSYWAYFSSTTTVEIAGTAITGASEDLTLSPGWNMIGSPFEISSWSEAMIGGEPAGESGLLETGLYYYNSAAGGYVLETAALSQWRGYFIKVGGTEPVTLEMPNGGTIIPQGSISGTASLEGLSDHTGININIAPDGEGDAVDVTTDASGAFSKSALPVDGYTVTASYTGFQNASTYVTVTDGEDSPTGLLLLEDTDFPAITSLIPTNGATVDTSTPAMSATFSDTGSGIDTSSVVITVAGSDVTTSAAVLSTGFTYTPPAALDDGSVTLTVAVSDMAGNSSAATSTFTVDTGGTVDPNQPSNVLASECQHGSHTLLCLTWDEAESQDVTGYNVYVYHDTEDIPLPYNGERPVPVNRYTVGGLTPGESYGIEITGVVEEGGLVVEESEHSDRANRSTVANAGNQAVVSFRAISEDSAQGAGRVAGRVDGNLLQGLVAVASATAVMADTGGTPLSTKTTGEFGWVEFAALDTGTYNMSITDDGGTPDPDDDIFIEKDDIELDEGEVYVIATAYLDMNGWGEFCGDGIANACEECDDGNRDDGDGCSATCMDETPDPSTHAGGICEDTTWYLADSPHTVEAPVYIRGFYDPTLTIEAGCEIKFDSGAALIAGTKKVDGGLVADGSGGAILFTSSSGAPSPGDWDGLVFGPKTLDSSTLDNVTVEYAGGGTGASVYIGGEIATFTNSTVQNGSGVGVYFAEGGLVANSFATNTVTANAQNPITVFANHVADIGTGNSLTGNNGNDVIKVESDTITAESNWRNFGIPYEILGDMWVYTHLTFAENLDVTAKGDIYVGLITGIPVFTVGAGTTMKFDPGTSLNVGVDSGEGNFDHGSIVADGTDSVITFTSSSGTPAAGDWEGLHFGEYTRPGTILDNVVIEYAGSASTASVIIEDEIDYIRNTIIRNGNGIGVAFLENAVVADGFATNTVTAHAMHPIDIYANSMPGIKSSNTITGNGDDVIKVTGHTAYAPAVWPNLSVPYEVSGDVIFTSDNTGAVDPFVFSDGIDVSFSGNVYMEYSFEITGDSNIDFGGDVIVSGDVTQRPVLTVGPNTNVKMPQGSKIEAGLPPNYYGGIIADGSTGAITFTSAESSPAAGDWKGIALNEQVLDTSLFNNVTIEYAGGATASLLVGNEIVSIDNCTISSGAGVGVEFLETGHTDTSFASNTITGHASYPVRLYAEYVPDIAASNNITGNSKDAIAVMGGTTVNGGTWANHGMPYEIHGPVTMEYHVTLADNLDVDVYDNIYIGKWIYRPTLTVGAGSTIRFDNGAGIVTIDGERGILVADGTSSTITFTSIQPSPAPGDWNGFTFGVDTYSGTLINNCVISYGGANGYGNIYLDDTSTNVTITNNTISNSISYGVYVGTGSTFDPADETTNAFSSNSSGDVFRE